MQGNMHVIDRVVRGIIGLLMIAVALFGSHSIFDIAAFSLSLVFMGIVLIVTALIGICPVYKASKFSTKRGGIC